ncbi:MAG: exodeoxyribonuclease VII small subunit [Clostridiales bacterium]|nr:exodeoxyribonuclease VII small subunit [Clostridiales bacterium]
MGKFDFEKSMEKLQMVVNELEKGDLTIDESIKMFKQGIELSRLCTQKLDEVEKEVTLLIEGDNGDITEEPFEVKGE